MFLRKTALLVTLAALMSTTLIVPIDAEEPAKVEKVAQSLLSSSVTIRADNASGSGSIVQTADGQVWVWTAAHVIQYLRRTREALDGNGGKRTKVEYDDAKVQQFRRNKDDGRIVSTFLADAEVVRASSHRNGHDLALLRVRDKEFKPAASAKFYLDKDIPEIGEELYHCGSLLGTVGHNSLTAGIMSQHGRVFDGKIYDQTTATSFPGSSGGIVCLKRDGRYVGMLTMGAGEGFGIIVPVRRMKQWAKEVDVEFALDPSKPVPTDEKLHEKPIEEAGSDSGGRNDNAYKERNAAGLKFMIIDTRDPFTKSFDIKKWFARPGLEWEPEEKAEPQKFYTTVPFPIVK